MRIRRPGSGSGSGFGFGFDGFSAQQGQEPMFLQGLGSQAPAVLAFGIEA